MLSVQLLLSQSVLQDFVKLSRKLSFLKHCFHTWQPSEWHTPLQLRLAVLQKWLGYLLPGRVLRVKSRWDNLLPQWPKFGIRGWGRNQGLLAGDLVQVIVRALVLVENVANLRVKRV